MFRTGTKVERSMRTVSQPTSSALCQGLRLGFAAGVLRAYGSMTAEPLPLAHVDLLLALRRGERERSRRPLR